jgi:hypothetical protein
MAGFDPQAFAQQMTAIIRDYVEREAAPLRKRVEELEAKSMRYQGVHQRAQAYRRGDACTHSGALWVAIVDAKEGEVPGKSDAWQLAVKGGAR